MTERRRIAVGGSRKRFSASFFLYSSFLDFALQYNIASGNRLILVDIFIQKE